MSVKYPQIDLPNGISGASDFWDLPSGLIVDNDYFASGIPTATGSFSSSNTVLASGGSATYRSHTSSAYSDLASGSIPSVVKPTGTVAGDLLIIFVSGYHAAMTLNVTFPAGFTVVTADNYYVTAPDGSTGRWAWKIAGASEPANYDLTVNANTLNEAEFNCVCITGVDQTTPITASLLTSNITGNSTPISVALGGVTASAGDCVIFYSQIDETTSASTWSHTPPSGYTERIDKTQAWVSVLLATQDNVTAGATGTLTATATRNTGSDTAGFNGWVIAVNAASGGAPTASATYSSSFSVNNNVTSSFSSSNTVNSSVASTYSSANSVRASVASSFSSAFSINANVSSSFSSAFSIINLVTGGYSSADVVLNFATGSYSSSNAVLANTLATGSFSSSFSVNAIVTGSYSSSDIVSNFASAVFGSANKVNGLVSSTFSSANSLFNFVTGSYSSADKVFGLISTTFGSLNSIYNFVSVTYSSSNTVGGASGSISASVSGFSTASINLTALGAIDWAVWYGSYFLIDPDERKSGGGSLISHALPLDNNVSATPVVDTSTRSISWTDGTPTAIGSSTGAGNYNVDSNGFVLAGYGNNFTVPADTTDKRAYVVLSALGEDTTFTIRAFLSDGSFATQTVFSGVLANGVKSSFTATIDYKAGSAGQTLIVEAYKTTDGAFGNNGYVALKAVALLNVTTLVSATYSSSNSINGTVGSSYSSANSVKNYVSSSYSSADSIYNFVSSSFSSADSVNNFATGSYSSADAVLNYVTSSYSSFNSVNTIVTGSYSSSDTVLNTLIATATYSSSFSVKNYVVGVYNSTFTVFGYTSSGFSSANSINALLSTVFNASYSVRSFASSTFTGAFSVINTLYSSSNYSSAYSVKGYILGSFNCSSSVDGIFGIFGIRTSNENTQIEIRYNSQISNRLNVGISTRENSSSSSRSNGQNGKR